MTEEFFIVIDELLAREYGWLPYQTDELQWAEVVRFTEAINQRSKQKQKEKLDEYIILTNIIHSSEPIKLLDHLRGLIPEEKYKNEIGDIQKINALKEKMSRRTLGGRTNGNR